MGLRRRAREYALRLLFQADVAGGGEKVTEGSWEEPPPPPPVMEFADLLVRGVLLHSEEINDLIARSAENWSLSRMSIVDRNILRFAVFELLYLEGIPAEVTINEAIEIAKKYGDEGSGAFVNGILDRIGRQEGKVLGCG